MTKILKPDDLINKFKEEILDIVNKLKFIPKLYIIRFNDNIGSISYEKSLIRAGEYYNIKVETISCIDKDIESIEKTIKKLNIEFEVRGIILLAPYPKNFDKALIFNSIDIKKDVDGLNFINRGALLSGVLDTNISLAPLASYLLLKEYGYNLLGKNCVIINDSEIVGRPLSMLLLNDRATVTICNEFTKNLKEITKKADFVFTAVGKAQIFDKTYFNENSVVIDIGISKNKDGKLKGDCSEDVEEYVSAICKSPGNIGKLVDVLLFRNMFKLELES